MRSTSVSSQSGSVDAERGSVDDLSHTGRDLSQLKQATSDGVWTWWHEPRSLRNNESTYVGWITRDGSTEVGQYDHASESWTTNVLSAQFEEDDHDNPTVLIDNSGYVWMFWSMHGDTAIRYKVSSSTGDVSSFGTEQTITQTGDITYPSPLQFSDGTITVWHRSTSGTGFGSPDYGYVSSTDGGSTWSASGILNSAYNKLHQDGDTVHFGVTAGYAHPRSGDTDIRYVRWDQPTNSYVDAVGNSVGAPPFNDSDLQMVWDSVVEGERAWMWDCAVTDDGNPVLVFATFSRGFAHHTYRYAKWDGAQWVVNKIADGGSYITNDHIEQQYSAGVCLDPTDPSTVYLSVGSNRNAKIQRWETNDNGETWSFADVVGSQMQNVRPTVPKGRHEDMQLLWCRGEYRHYAHKGYDMEVAWSDGTPTASVDQPAVSIPYDHRTTLERTTAVSIAGDDTFSNINWGSEENQKGNFWDGANQASDYNIYLPAYGIYTITVEATLSAVTAAGTYVLDLFEDTQTIASDLELGRKTAASGDDVRLSGTATIEADGSNQRDGGRVVARVKQDSASATDLNYAKVYIVQQSP